MTRAMLRLMLRLVLSMTTVKITVFAVESSSSSFSFGKTHRDSREPLSPRELKSSSFYTRYSEYPPYCSVPAEMETRRIPPLRAYMGKSRSSSSSSNATGSSSSSNNNINNKLIGETRLVHVTAIIRHGARTPWSSQMKCWDGFWDSPETGKWDCDDITTFLATPSRNGHTHRRNKQDNHPASGLLFEKRYDSLHYPEDGLTNSLNGTCQMGQLLLQGYDQELLNGRMLREAYTYKKGEYDHDERMRLLDLSLAEGEPLPWEHPRGLYFRSDDYQRVVMSGQVLLRGLFDPELEAVRKRQPNKDIVVPLHIADVEKDVMDANENDCPRLRSIREAALQSEEYKAFNNSRESREVREYMRRELGMDEDASLVDCFMCTMCTDRPLPEGASDYDGTDANWFSRLVGYGIEKYTGFMMHNSSEYAKLAMAPLWHEIMGNIRKVLAEEGGQATMDNNNNNNNNNGGDRRSSTAPKLALFAGHDTTLMPLLASLGPGLWDPSEWASYASMLLIEIHELIDGRSDPEIYKSSFAFRLVYNGNILTPMIDGCHENSELCDIDYLKAVLVPIAARYQDCSVPDPPSEDEALDASSSTAASAASHSSNTTNSGEPSFASLSTTTGMAVFVTLVLLSGFGGSALTFVVLRKSLEYSMARRNVDFGGAWDIDNTTGDGENGLELT